MRRFAAVCFAGRSLVAALLCHGVVAVALATTAATAAPDFELPTLDGKRFIRLSETRGKVTVINFWDTECPPCIREMPLLDSMAKQHADVVFIGVAVSPKDAVRGYLDLHPVSFPQLIAPSDPRGLLRRFGDAAGALPHTVVLRSDGSPCGKKTGEVDAGWMKEALAECR